MENQDEKKPWRHRLVDWFYDFWIDAAMIFVAGLTAIAGAVYSDEFTTAVATTPEAQRRIKFWGMIGFFACTVAQIALAITSLKRAKRISKLELQLDQCQSQNREMLEETANFIQDVFDICDGFLYILAAHGPLEQSHTDRVSLYARDEKSRQFLLLGRYAVNENWRKSGRKAYPSDQGCIARAWENDEHYEADFPDRADVDRFKNFCNGYGIPIDVASSLRMPSRFYYGWKVRDLSGHRAIAVLILESTKPNRYTRKELRDIVDGLIGMQLRDLLQRLSPRIPRMSLAREAGF
jgi:hypothetical protein